MPKRMAPTRGVKRDTKYRKRQDDMKIQKRRDTERDKMIQR